jgi:DNA-binding HxlR family transcriptional regulator
MEILHSDNCKKQLIALRDSLEIFGGKWKLLILICLAANLEGADTFLNIKRVLSKISAKVLSKELKELESNHLVERTEQPTKPVTVCYKITEHGRSILPVAEVLMHWGQKHRENILG